MKKNPFLQSVEELKEVLEASRKLNTAVERAAEIIVSSLRDGGKVMVCGNGGSAADAQHMAAELVNRFLKDRAPMAAIALTTDSSILTSVANDYSFDFVFSKQVEAIGEKRDVLVGISTSGNSRNVIRAFESAKKMGIVCIALLGKDGGSLEPISDLALIVPSFSTPRIQEVHQLIIHAICQMVEYELFEQNGI